MESESKSNLEDLNIGGLSPELKIIQDKINFMLKLLRCEGSVEGLKVFSEQKKAVRKDFVDFENDMVRRWNELVGKHPSLTAVMRVNEERRKHLKKRFDNDHFRGNVVVMFEKIDRSGFLLGRNDRGWKVNFDFIIKNDSNYLKMLEGRYDDNSKMGVHKFIKE